MEGNNEDKSNTDQWASADVDSKEFKEKNGDLSEDDKKKEAAKSVKDASK
jgi:hypothetical protein